MDTIDTVIVAPLVPEQSFKPTNRLHPIITVNEERYIVAVHDLGATVRRGLTAIVANAANGRDAIIAAIDLVFTGI